MVGLSVTDSAQSAGPQTEKASLPTPVTINADRRALPAKVQRRDRFIRIFLGAVALLASFVPARPASASPAEPAYVEPLNTATLDRLKALYKQLIDAENRHDLATVRPMVWISPSALFVAKTATPAEGNWAGFWGTETVIAHLGELYKAGPFRIDPDYAKVKVVGLTPDVAETYAPVQITVAYARQSPVPKPFLMILEWVRTGQGWRMATDIALPIPPSPPVSKY